MLGSGAVWGVVLGHTALNWGDYTLAQQLPTYLTNVLGYEGGTPSAKIHIEQKRHSARFNRNISKISVV